MTKQELNVFDKTAELWNVFNQLPELHQSDKQEFCFHIHAIQNIILAREGLRKIRESEISE